MLVEILQRATSMPVAEPTEGETVVANHVYVIPPDRDLVILHGRVHLLPAHIAHGQHLPVDTFFRALAEDCRERAVGVILSGMGSDGTLGLRAIKENAGASFVQLPSSAKFDAMPRSAIEAGLADAVVPVEELPRRIVSYVEQRTHTMVPDSTIAGQTATLERIFVLLRAISGND